jgi:hypothetical protein
MGASNPKDATSEFGKRCEPVGGWNVDSEEEEWTSVRGWRVYRIDGSKTENVSEKRMVPGCEGLMTHAGFLAAISNAGGEGTPEYWTMVRGMFPPINHASSIISRASVDCVRGEWQFEDLTVDVYGVDSSLTGGDSTILTVGRFGPAKNILKLDGEIEEIHEETRMVLQIDHQILVNVSNNSLATARAVLRELPDNINPEFLAIDSTGTADGCASALADSLGDILMVVASESPTDYPVMGDDERIAKDMYTNKRAEMWYGFRAWVDAGLVAFSAACDDELLKELTTARGELSGKKYRVERKDRYKKRTRGKSPDRADSAILLVYLLRIRGDVVQGFLTSERRPSDPVNSDIHSETAYGSELDFVDAGRD